MMQLQVESDHLIRNSINIFVSLKSEVQLRTQSCITCGKQQKDLQKIKSNYKISQTLGIYFITNFQDQPEWLLLLYFQNYSA